MAGWLLFLLAVGFSSVGPVQGNQPPLVSFGPTGGNIFPKENTSIGTQLFTITAVDADSVDLIFNMVNDETRSLVELGSVTQSGDTWSVPVLLRASLDRDRSPNVRDLLFRVSDGPSEIQGRVKLIIRDVNDNPPLFVNLPYRISLNETSQVNTTVFTVSTTDPDDGPGGSVVFSMAAHAQGADEEYNKTFVIRNPMMGEITLALPLDFETRNYYQYQIFAKDRGTPECPGPECYCSNVTEPNVECAGEPAIFTVTVLDVQDTPPRFERLPYIAEVHENDTVGTSFYQVTALDGDRGIPNPVTYSIVDEANYPFTIEAHTGILRVGSRGLDSDQSDGRNFIITVMASEVLQAGQQPGGETNATTKVSIAVLDVNDNGPQFSQDVYVATVQENTPSGVPLTMSTRIEVEDHDQNENSQFRLSVEKDGALYDVFTTLPGSDVNIQGRTTVMIAVQNSSQLDYETTKNLTFQIRAAEISTTEQYSNTTTVILTIVDMNDNSPVFLPNQTTDVEVTEHETLGVVLATFSATDDDTGDYGTVEYYLEDGLGKFDMGRQSGNLTVIADIDREEPGGEVYSLVVVATDSNAGPEAQRRSTRLNIRVRVLDINDNPPIFQIHSPSITVQENASPGTALMTLTASDKDEGPNREVIYTVVGVQSLTPLLDQPQNLFDIDRSTGVVFVNASLIGYPGEHNVTFMAVDSAAEPKNVTTSVTVFVQDVNINEPVFIVPDQALVNTAANILPNITVDEELPVGTQLIQLNATDVDTGNNGLVYYQLDPDLSGQFNYFSVDALSGWLTNKMPLDREQTDMFQISLKAEDQGTPTRLSTIIPFRVILRDINDNDPEFLSPALITLEAGEETRNVRVGYVNIATDADFDPDNTEICYYLYSGQLVDSFFLVRETGELRLLRELDRDNTPEVNLTVKALSDCLVAEDFFTSSGSNNVYNASDKSLLQVVVRVKDINDNGPVMEEDALSVGLLYDKEIGFEVINLATFTRDGDSPENSRNYYRMLDYRVGGEASSGPPYAFRVSVNGSVVTTRLFGAEEKGFFVLTVEAYDNDNHTDVADVTIYLVSDVQRIKLVFNALPNKVEQIKGDVVTRLSDALDMTVIADKIATHITADGTANPGRTDMFIHARYRPSGEIVPASVLWNEFDYNPEVRAIFQDNNVTETLQVLQPESDDDDNDMEKAFIIVAVILVIICLVLAIVLFNTIRRYRRRLRAATTSAFVSKQEDNGSYVPPGTNKYYAAENPLFGRDVKPIDVDRLDNDNDSLDNNAVDGRSPMEDDKDKEEEQEMYLELYDDDSGPGVHINHLAMVLDEYEQSQDPNKSPSSPAHSPSPQPYPEDDASDKWKSSANGHVKSDSGYNEADSGNGLDNLQHTDI